MNLNFNGILELNDNNQYIVNNKNVSDVLENNWKKEVPATYSLFVNGKQFKSEECVLRKEKYKGLLYDLHAEGVNIDNKLFNAVGKLIELDITYGKVS